MEQNLLGKSRFPVCAPGSEQEVSEGLPAGTWVLGMGTQGRKCRGQILAVL